MSIESKIALRIEDKIVDMICSNESFINEIIRHINIDYNAIASFVNIKPEEIASKLNNEEIIERILEYNNFDLDDIANAIEIDYDGVAKYLNITSNEIASEIDRDEIINRVFKSYDFNESKIVDSIVDDININNIISNIKDQLQSSIDLKLSVNSASQLLFNN